jgi:uncharacterized protein
MAGRARTSRWTGILSAPKAVYWPRGTYAPHFTAEEMQQVTNFYRSPTGQKFLQKQPELVRESMALGQQFGQAIARDVQGRMVEELRKRGHPI